MSLANSLAQFTGTTHYYRHWFPPTLLYTDGAKYFFDEAGAYWFLDLIGLYLVKLTSNERFLSITLHVNNGIANVHVTDGNDNTIPHEIKHDIHTDAPEGEWHFFLIDDSEQTVLLLPSEY